MEHPSFVGIDVSNTLLDVFVRPLGESFPSGLITRNAKTR